MLDEHGFCDYGTRAARTGESGDRRQQMQKQDDQIAHGTIMPPREIQEMLRLWQFAIHRSKRQSWSVRVPSTTEHALKTIRSRNGKGSGSASAASSVTMPRMPAHEMTTPLPTVGRSIGRGG